MHVETKVPSMEIDDSSGRKGEEIYKHDAFGMIGMGVIHGGHEVLFGSDIGHNDRIRLTIKRAEHRRGLANDWYHGRDNLIEVEMSHSQFAQFITSPNRGDGIPCTIKYAPEPGTPVKMMPHIQKTEGKLDTFKREVKQATKESLIDMRRDLEKLKAMIDSGKLSKAELKSIVFNLDCTVTNLPSNLHFIVEQGEEALEKAATHAKMDVEAYIDNAARRLGLDTLDQLKQLTNKGQQNES